MKLPQEHWKLSLAVCCLVPPREYGGQAERDEGRVTRSAAPNIARRFCGIVEEAGVLRGRREPGARVIKCVVG